MTMLINIALVLLFILIGGIFAATEMALVSLRESQIRQLERGTGAAQTVARLARDSGLFLSAVQVGVTFAGFFSSAFGASTIAPQIAPYLVEAGLGETAASMSALVLMTILTSYLSLVLGELVPKRIAMQKAKRVSVIVAPPLDMFAKLMTPVIWVIDTSSSLILRGLGFDPKLRTSAMTTKEIREIVSSHKGFGLGERELVTEVFEAGAHAVGAHAPPQRDGRVFRRVHHRRRARRGRRRALFALPDLPRDLRRRHRLLPRPRSARGGGRRAGR